MYSRIIKILRNRQYIIEQYDTQCVKSLSNMFFSDPFVQKCLHIWIIFTDWLGEFNPTCLSGLDFFDSIKMNGEIQHISLYHPSTWNCNHDILELYHLFNYRLYQQQIRSNLISNLKSFICELPHGLPKDLKLRSHILTKHHKTYNAQSSASLIPVQVYEESLKCRYFNFLVLPNSVRFFCWIINFFICKYDMEIQKAKSKSNQNQIKIKT